MVVEKDKKWLRSPNTKKFFALNFGVNYNEDIVRMQFGDERAIVKPKEEANITDVEITTTRKSFNDFIKLIEMVKKEMEKE